MLNEIGSVQNIPKFIEKAKSKDDKFRLMGFGHRVYKNYDPRAKVMQKMCHKVLEMTKNENHLLKVIINIKFQLALKLEETALNDEYFTSRKLYPNVDFYTGIVYEALCIPVDMFTVMFAVIFYQFISKG